MSHIYYVKLKDVCFVQGGYAFKSEAYTDSGVPLVRISNISDNIVALKGNVVYLNETYLKSHTNYIIRKGDILIALSGATTGKYGIYNSDDVSFLNQRVGRVIAKSDKINNQYLFFYMNQIKDLIFNNAYGVAQPNISPSDIGNFKIPLPPLAVQQKIAAVLDKADRLRRLRKQAIEKLDQLTQSVFLDMFGDPVTNPKNWEVGRIMDLVSQVNYGTSKKAGDIGMYPILRMGNITYNGGWNLNDKKYIDLEEEEKEKYFVKKGDLLFNRTNSKELVGKTAVFRENEAMAFAGYLIRVRANKHANTEYISGFLNSRYGKTILQNMCKNIIGMANINAQELQRIRILIPPVELQSRYANIVKKILNRKEYFHLQLMKIEQLFNSILQRAFKGELAFNDDYFNKLQKEDNVVK